MRNMFDNPMSKKIEIYTTRGPEGAALVVNGTRVCGPKAWGGGRILDEFEVDKKELYEALRKPSTKARLWRRVARLAGEALFFQGPHESPFAMEGTTDAVEEIRFITDSLRDEPDDQFVRKAKRLADKLEAALKAWEAAP